ncbi:MAG: DUF6600 domain-containing protein [Candidatus Tyrphobacter sp.]
MVTLAALAFVAHIGVLAGHATISTSRGRSFVALRNAPLLAGDTVTTLGSTQAEAELDSLVSIRLDANAAVRIDDLTPHRRRIALLFGTIDLSSERNGDSPRVETPSVTLAPDSPALVRISVSAGITSAFVRRGTLRIITPNGVEVLSPGELVTLTGDPSTPTLRYAAVPATDAFDGFNQTRDGAKRGIAGLEPYGSWITLAHYGRAWQPREFPGWAPYHSGRWFWRSAIGWIWIARESWGWLPYHYGAWIDDPARGWCWVPSAPQSARWMSANAVFFAIVVRGRTQSVGWVPLAPGEPFHSGLDEYVNARARGGLDEISRGAFYSGDFSRIAFPSLASLTPSVRLAAPPSPKR